MHYGYGFGSHKILLSNQGLFIIINTDCHDMSFEGLIMIYGYHTPKKIHKIIARGIWSNQEMEKVGDPLLIDHTRFINGLTSLHNLIPWIKLTQIITVLAV